MEKTFTVSQVTKLLKQQAFVNALENACGHEWEYGDPRRGDVYGEMAKVQKEVFTSLLNLLEIMPESITPCIPEVEIEEEEEEDDIGIDEDEEDDEIEVNQDDLDLVRKKLNLSFDEEEEK